MKSILQELYYGNLEPCEQFEPISDAYKKEQKKQIVHYEELESKLMETDPELFKLFVQVYDDIFLTVPYKTEAAFICGFRMGSRFMLDALETEGWD